MHEFIFDIRIWARSVTHYRLKHELTTEVSNNYVSQISNRQALTQLITQPTTLKSTHSSIMSSSTEETARMTSASHTYSRRPKKRTRFDKKVHSVLEKRRCTKSGTAEGRHKGGLATSKSRTVQQLHWLSKAQRGRQRKIEECKLFVYVVTKKLLLPQYNNISEKRVVSILASHFGGEPHTWLQIWDKCIKTGNIEQTYSKQRGSAAAKYRRCQGDIWYQAQHFVDCWAMDDNWQNFAVDACCAQDSDQQQLEQGSLQKQSTKRRLHIKNIGFSM